MKTRILLFSLSVLLLIPACAGGPSQAVLTPRPTTPQPSQTTALPTPSAAPTGVAPGDLIPLTVYPTKVPPLLNPFPGFLVYGGRASVQGRNSARMAVIRFGEGHPAFQPSILTGSPGQHLELLIASETPVKHNFSTLDQRVDRDTDVGKTVSVTVTFPMKGVLIFYCKYHLVDFQIGELQVRQ